MALIVFFAMPKIQDKWSRGERSEYLDT